MKTLLPLALVLPLWLGLMAPALGTDTAEPVPGTDLGAPASAAHPPTGRSISLAEALAMAQSYSMRLQMASARVDAAQAGIATARSAYYPKLQAMAKTEDAIDRRYEGYRRTNDEYGQTQVSLQYTALDFGRRKAELTRSEFNKQGSELALRQEASDLQFDTVRAYVDSERYRRMLIIAHEHTAELRRLATLMEERVRGGLSPQSEVIRSRLALTNAQNRLKTIAKNFDQAQQSLRALTGETVRSEPIGVKLDAIEVPADVLASSIEGNFSLQSLRAQLSGADAAWIAPGPTAIPRSTSWRPTKSRSRTTSAAWA
ncbi:hypothetical protein DDE05_19155 [Streptomyces cavourensis]|nr:hypothetical protein DDE05_19155 [Streptomyces cavourensis]